MNLKIKKLNNKAIIPSYGTDFAAGFDLRACLEEDVVIKPKEVFKIPIGISMEIPAGYVGLVYARSGISTKHLITPINKVGVVDSDYRGQIFVFLYNESNVDFKVSNGDRIAQMVITPYAHVNLVEVDELNETKRGENGFGSTGIK